MKLLYIAAVSGGVDSCVMLHRLMAEGKIRVIVAHVDHGMRPESDNDAEFVRNLAEKYNLPFESIRLKLGPNASEAQAREKRWDFLHRIRNKHHADKIATGHTADDVVETMIINIIRGTGWRGIASLIATNNIARPVLNMRKRDVLGYAGKHNLTWHEDTTNQDTTFLRNRIRSTVMPRIDDTSFARLLELSHLQTTLRKRIETELAYVMTLNRHNLIMWPDEVAQEVMRARLGALPLSELRRTLLFARTARAGKSMQLSNGQIIKSEVGQLIVGTPKG